MNDLDLDSFVHIIESEANEVTAHDPAEMDSMNFSFSDENLCVSFFILTCVALPLLSYVTILQTLLVLSCVGRSYRIRDGRNGNFACGDSMRFTSSRGKSAITSRDKAIGAISLRGSGE